MARKSLTPGRTVLDQSFYIPEGVEGFEHNQVFDDPDEDFIEVQDTQDLDTTFKIKIISQKLRESADGRTVVVDVVVEVEDIVGADNYEIRVAKPE